MNNEILIERGNAAEQILKQDVFTAAVNEIINIYVGGLLQTSPEQTKEREAAYAGARAVQDIVGVLNQWIAIRDQIIENLANEENEEPDSI
jgi:hypothetical protein